MTTLRQAYRLATAEARKYRETIFVLVRTLDDFGNPTVEYCAEEGSGILYGPQLKYGLAAIVGKVSFDHDSGQVTGFMADKPVYRRASKLDRAARADAEVAQDYDAGQRQAMAGLADE